ncbi:unnamed protein product [Rotaria sp. Silwood2]|nr:unnamed protein product [Rotaria sp. Silwood2]CAF2528507.1 unnamed protein product [Rotaria sp. Silwood2]CAF2938942.1 unnamed protein product [Rotaria sp. Silwood2]CAF3896333.1 unnamed protein product [Rotaria sp. Silwood2]CAF3937955.1 unnamed protein product [Rotaria sp. Silwood2]
MSKASVETYSLIELPSISTSLDTNHRQMPMNNDDQRTKITESYTPEHGSPNRNSPARVRFLEPGYANNTTPKSPKSIKNVPSFESFEASSIDNINDLHHDGPNSVSRGLQTDISNASVIDWVLGQKSSSTGDSVFRNEQAQDLSTERDRVRVIVRYGIKNLIIVYLHLYLCSIISIRPVNNREMDKNDRSILNCEGENSILVEGTQHSRRFTFDTVFDVSSTQEEVFHYSGIKRLVDMAIEGYISTCFAYGQTGSGKTHTMIGPGGAGIFRMDENYRIKNFGLVPRAINYLFQRLREKAQETNTPYFIRVSYCEIYNEQIHDLINPSHTESLQLRGSIEDGFYVENLFQTYIETMDELLTILEEGELNRAMASHNLNDTSSRSHAMLSIQVEQDLQDTDDPKEQRTRQGKLVFVDLAGSEKVKVSLSKGKQLTETNNINKSLLTLGTCISALSDPVKRAGHIPYRDSKLTRLLVDSLGGHGITLMIACISPASSCENESLSTLRYANRAKNIENAPIIKTDSKENVINRLKREVRKLKDENHELKQKLGIQANALPKIKNRSSESGSLTSMRSSASIDPYDSRQDNQGRLSGTTTKKIRTDHEILTRENEKLVRKLDQVMREQQTQPGDKHVIVVEEDPSGQELNSSYGRRTNKNYSQETNGEISELVRHPSYASRYRSTRERYPDDTSPQRRTATIVRRVPDTAVVEGKYRQN